jgi:putative ABC transport system substrate-binding protein
MDRRAFIVMVGASVLATSIDARAQQAVKAARIGYLAGNLATGPAFSDAFRQGLRDLGYVEGRDVVIEFQDAQGKAERLPALAAELVARKVDIILAPGTQHAMAAKQATTTIPIVFADISDPESRGLVASLARPGGNITGLSNLQPDLIGKSLELLKQAVPGVNDVAFLWQPDVLPERAQREIRQRAEVAAKATRAKIHLVEVRGPEDFDKAFFDMSRARINGLIVWGGVMFISERRRLVELAAKNRLPATYPMGEFVDAGGLMSYSPNIADNFRRAAVYVDKILKGAKPADLPVEAAHQVRVGHQPQSREDARPRDPAIVLGTGRSGDPVAGSTPAASSYVRLPASLGAPCPRIDRALWAPRTWRESCGIHVSQVRNQDFFDV